MDEKRKRAWGLSEWLEERHMQFRLEFITEYEAQLHELNKLIPELRQAAWEAQEREHQALVEEQTQILETGRATRQLIAQKESELQSARGVGDPSASELAAEIEELNARLRKLAPRQKALTKVLSGYKRVEHFRGTLGELRIRALKPDFYLDRNWLAAMLIGVWFGLADGDQVSVRFPLDTGLPTAPTDYSPNEPRRR